ncbi:hypothetical protein AND_009721 [Anopheles darlingi]|uniref:Uncharacterized protein n=1 Tax=Anopheles darlingi TaxID=43151 RepID=W5J471_ANODA|nr:hypothetical protein AND_009721 [Anopheles darlingi]
MMAVFRSFQFVRGNYTLLSRRFYGSMSSKQGLVLGVYSTEDKDEVKFTPYAQKYNESTAGKLLEQINMQATNARQVHQLSYASANQNDQTLLVEIELPR